MESATVLLIDSDADSITIYSLILRHHGYRVVHAADFETAVRLVAEADPDVVVSELFTTSRDERDVVEFLRGDERTSNKPLILLDSAPSRGRRPELASLPRLTKPCEPSRLLREVGRALNPRHQAT